MILTGTAIAAAVAAGEITIDPYDPARLSPNAYDWRLGQPFASARRPGRRRPHPLHRGHHPRLRVRPAARRALPRRHPGEDRLRRRYAQTAQRRPHRRASASGSTSPRHFGHQGHAIRWTLEIRAARPVRIYPGMTFGKLVFLRTYGPMASYQLLGRKYTSTDGIDISRLYEEFQEDVP